MSWLAKNWVWIVLGIAAYFVGSEVVSYLWAGASKQSSTCWFNKFWSWGTASTSGPAASGSGGARNEAAACVPASAQVESVNTNPLATNNLSDPLVTTCGFALCTGDPIVKTCTVFNWVERQKPCGNRYFVYHAK